GRFRATSPELDAVRLRHCARSPIQEATEKKLAALPGVTAATRSEEAHGKRQTTGILCLGLADAKVRFISGSCLRRLCHWLALLFAGSRRPSFLARALLLREPNSKVRANLLDLLASLFQGSKAFSAASSRRFRRPQDRFHARCPHRLAGSLREMHRQILQALLAERSQANSGPAAAAALVNWPEMCPTRNCAGPRHQDFQVASPFLLSESPDVKSAALQCFGQLASLEGPAFEVSHCLLQDCLRSPAASPMLTGFHTPLLGPQTAPFESSWLVQHCLRSQQQAALEPTAVRVEALATLRWLVLRYWNFVSPVSEAAPPYSAALPAARVQPGRPRRLGPRSRRSADLAAARGGCPPLSGQPSCQALLSCLQPAAPTTASAPPLPNASRCLTTLRRPIYRPNYSATPSRPCWRSARTASTLSEPPLFELWAPGLLLVQFDSRIMAEDCWRLVWRFADLCAGNRVACGARPGRLVAGSGLGGSPSACPNSRGYPPSPPLLSEADLVRLFLAGMNLCADAPKVRENAARLLGNLFCLAALCSTIWNRRLAAAEARGHLRACMEQAATGWPTS
uniref:DUF4042 domain-containing protein n=1 Tax=Macrostomum lignano TaxID=282301 RepID=A0A1I8F912_9PLAT